MEKDQETRATWNKVAGRYAERFMHMDLYNATYDAFIGRLPKGKPRLLDIGCGPGNISRYLAESLPEADITGIDYAAEMVSLARAHVPRGRFEVMDCRVVATLKDPFDGIVCGFCLPYLSPVECAKFMADCAGLLVSEGVFYVSFVPGDIPDGKWITGSEGDSVYFHYHPEAAIRDLVEECGFCVKETFKIPYPKGEGVTETHMVWVCCKNG